MNPLPSAGCTEKTEQYRNLISVYYCLLLRDHVSHCFRTVLHTPNNCISVLYTTVSNDSALGSALVLQIITRMRAREKCAPGATIAVKVLKTPRRIHGSIPNRLFHTKKTDLCCAALKMTKHLCSTFKPCHFRQHTLFFRVKCCTYGFFCLPGSLQLQIQPLGSLTRQRSEATAQRPYDSV